jgi:Holliday junction resolvase-like predicted endonuclease
MAKHNEIGVLGEDLTVSFLMKHGFSILDRNVRNTFGEIDIVAMKNDILHFVEVKSISVRTLENFSQIVIRPEEHLTPPKWRNILTSVEIYLRRHYATRFPTHQIDLSAVYIEEESRQAKITILQNISMEGGSAKF